MDQANDFVRDITAAFIKHACNRRVDDAGTITFQVSLNIFLALESGIGGAAGKKKAKKGGK